ncbi:SREBP regulating gene protein [Tachypleus tridentatus]|uniref:SREBP regulating gene protein n=1 Tax=Tachypleus tridentatus TaxID=6853 RepID=UPI003FD5FEB3
MRTKRVIRTMKLKNVVRLLKNRLFLAIVLTCSFVYCIVSLVREGSTVETEELDLQKIHLPGRSFQWHVGRDFKENNSEKVVTCRNSVQGKVLIADDRGYVCQRHDVLPSGCCNVNAHTTKQYCCETCQENGCCSIYEYCISCCLQPDKKVLLQKILGKASEKFNVLLASITDQFELCLTKCRTSSQSVEHENSYKDPKAKHCYGESPPVAQPSVS